MNFNSFNKNILSHIVLVISLIILFTCIVHVLISVEEEYSDSVKWNGLTYILPSESTYEISDEYLIVDNPIDSYNIRLKKTYDLSGYDKYIVQNFNNIHELSYNSSHKMLINDGSHYIAVVSKKSVEDNPTSNPYKIRDDVEIIEVYGKNTKYMSSFLMSAYEE